MLELRKFKSKIRKKHVIYSTLVLVFIIILIFYIVSRAVEGNFIETAFNNKFPDIVPIDDTSGKNSYQYFMSSYVDSFFIYAASALVLLWILRIILRAVKKKISPDIFNTLNVLVRIIIIPFFLIAYLNSFNAFTGALIGVAATIGAAFGIAAARSVSDLFAGLYLVFSKYHNVEDYLIIPSLKIEGVVGEISINFMKILQPSGVIAIIPNSKLRDQEILNLSKILVEKERDGVTDFLLYGKRVIETHYIYPLKWACDPVESHETCVEAISKTAVEFKDQLEAEVKWQITERERLNRTYLISLEVLNSIDLLDLVGDFSNSLEANYEKLKSEG